MRENELPAAGLPLEGGYYTGKIVMDGKCYAVITAPSELELSASYGLYGNYIESARSMVDSIANTLSMAEAGSSTAKTILAIDYEGYTDWCIPARDVLELQYRMHKPTADENCCSFRDGDNASSVPVGYPYSKNSPAQASVDIFRLGGEQAFNPTWYLSSSQYSAGSAFVQYFQNGEQDSYDKTNEFRVRPVRIVLLC